MSVDNFDGNGLADQPSIIYGFDDTANTGGLPDIAQALLDDTTVEHTDSEDIEIRELSRSGYGEIGPSSGDVIERDSTKSTLDTRFPRLDLPAQDGLNRDDCGEDKSAFACLDSDSVRERSTTLFSLSVPPWRITVSVVIVSLNISNGGCLTATVTFKFCR
jgi:hypothetical protein